MGGSRGGNIKHRPRGGGTHGRGRGPLRGPVRGKGSRGPVKEDRPPPLCDEDVSTMACRAFMTGDCPRGGDCRYLHYVKRLHEVVDAHSDGKCINDVILIGDTLFTGGSDGKLRTWKAVPTPAGHIELTPDLIVDTDGQPVMSVHFEPTPDEAGNMTGGGVMFCGLEDGRVRVFDKTTGAQFDLLGHAKAVHSLGVLQGILVTSSWDGTVRLWTPKEGTYENTHTIEIGYPVKCMTIAEQTMWIGGVCGITGISIMDLTIQGRIDTQSPVMKMLIYENHVVAITLDGKLFVFDPNGNETASMDCALNYVHNGDKLRKPCCNSCLDGVVINGKAALLVGQMNGSVRAYTLPTLKPLVWWQTAMQRKNADVRIVKSLVNTNLFVTGCADGSLSLWQWQNMG
ncbi:hypothetical protein FOZ62_009955 [Perkinsus olseni]|uniref:C3H1-type domain-containing protein n=1 Tax=Perkinsus olseni TaxID=32597 RepID=A0A7J6PZN4_PEROL|nr:hypothetical protein FOZ62_009955 [Perkinsus olseni]